MSRELSAFVLPLASMAKNLCICTLRRAMRSVKAVIVDTIRTTNITASTGIRARIESTMRVANTPRTTIVEESARHMAGVDS